ncbi:uncharacterized protein TRIADDRAFT_58258 [Trichoplax adhaerens]|uniref:39S ribosomal protein L13, mitochondrial n=1 Tax=Trichoplax adhaerens TaxID=10228 RepID=B3S1A8_TRIAD|nr:hypothetical protein TRIADDRAFT_58258 [Trichoplax adhaerens]EDV23210.1 hypothetical protein TRIADDRAFT_58258 [Trichoplax adhaerens]|eukprot:XP_002114120.1 hypothetical protein TRIADDRAFT_58258 [Trichoplax adhaerens]
MSSFHRASQSLRTHARMWYLIDAKDQKVGRLATFVVKLLQGKTKPIYHPAADVGDFVVIVNTQDVVFTGKKWNDKLYRHHTGYPGGLKEIKAKDLHAKDPREVLRKAIYGMLAKNNLRYTFMRRLYLYKDKKHPYKNNITQELTGPCKPAKKLQDYTPAEIENYPYKNLF